jgi:hypothetical protein
MATHTSSSTFEALLELLGLLVLVVVEGFEVSVSGLGVPSGFVVFVSCGASIAVASSSRAVAMLVAPCVCSPVEAGAPSVTLSPVVVVAGPVSEAVVVATVVVVSLEEAVVTADSVAEVVAAAEDEGEEEAEAADALEVGAELDSAPSSVTW